MLTLQHEVLDVGREIGVGLEPVAPGDARQHEAAPVVLVLRCEATAQFLDARDGQLHELREHPRLDRLGGRQHDGLDRGAPRRPDR